MKKDTTFEHQVVIITGASSGIGRATAIRFAQSGATVVLTARNEPPLRETEQAIKAFGGKTLVLTADVSIPEQVQSLIHTVIDTFGRIDILINNAGGGAVGTVENPHFIDDSRHLLEVDYFGKIYACRAALPIMHKQGIGTIVNLSSVVGRKAFPKFGAYSASMHAVAAFSDTLRQELHHSGIHVCSVHPALTRTAFFQDIRPAERPAQFQFMRQVTPELVANKIIKAVKKKTGRVIIPWQPYSLLLTDIVSVRLGDLMVRLLAKPLFMRLIAMYHRSDLNVNTLT